MPDGTIRRPAEEIAAMTRRLFEAVGVPITPAVRQQFERTASRLNVDLEL